jgi:hypothetical protein
LSRLNAGLSALGATALPERDKLGAVMAVLHYVRGAAALAIEAGAMPDLVYPGLLKKLVDDTRFPRCPWPLELGCSTT